jgi:hypothetical protein
MCLQVVCRFDRHGQDEIPIGVQFAGRFGDEPSLFRLTGQLEQARPGADKKPPIHLSVMLYLPFKGLSPKIQTIW